MGFEVEKHQLPETPETGRRGNGTFSKGQSGNPGGRPAGSRNRATLAALALLEGDAEQLTRKAIELAHSGDVSALRLCFERLLPVRKDRFIQFALPPLKDAADGPEAIAAIANAVAQGELTVSEGTEMAKIVEAFTRTKEASDVDERLKVLEAVAVRRE